MFAVQADGAGGHHGRGPRPADGELSPVQAALRECHGLQCGFCTPGFVIVHHRTAARTTPARPTTEIREGLSGNFCRCTGYQGIVNAVHLAAAKMQD